MLPDTRFSPVHPRGRHLYPALDTHEVRTTMPQRAPWLRVAHRAEKYL